MPRLTGSWLSAGPALPAGSDEPQSHRGELLGLPADGVGSLAGAPRRVGALALDWLMALAVAGAVLAGAPGGQSTATLIVWAVIGAVTVALFTFTPGQFLVGVRVAPVPVTPQAGGVVAGVRFGPSIARSVLLALVVPGLLTDRDGRGLHDRLTGTAVLRSR